MYNPARQAYNNLKAPKAKRKQETLKSMGLLSRGPKSAMKTNKTELEPNERIANYVMEIRQGRQEINNG